MLQKRIFLTESSLFSIVTFIALLFAIFLVIIVNNNQKAYLSEAYTFASTLSMAAPHTVPQNSSIQLTISTMKPDASDWIGLYAFSADVKDPLATKSVKDCTLSLQNTGLYSGACSFTSPSEPGLYHFRLFRTSLQLSESNTFSVDY